MKNRLYLGVASVAMVLGLVVFAPVVSAQSDSLTVEEVIQIEAVIDENGEGLEGIVVKEIKTVPTSFGLWWREIGERMSLLVTLDSVKKAEKRIAFAEERIALAEKILSESDDEGVQEKAQRMLDKAIVHMNKVEEEKDKFLENIDGRKERLLKNIANHHLRRTQALDRIEAKIPEDKVEEFQKRRENSEDKGRLFLDSIISDRVPEKTLEHLRAVGKRVEDQAEINAEFRANRRRLLNSGSSDPSVRSELKILQEERLDSLKSVREEYKIKVLDRAQKVKIEEARRIRLDKDNAQKNNNEARVESGNSVEVRTEPAREGGSAARLNNEARIQADSGRVIAEEKPTAVRPPAPAVRAIREAKEVQVRAEERKIEVQEELDR